MNTLRIFIAGATGTLGRRLVPQLIARGHHVVGTTRSRGPTTLLRALGAEPVVVDPLDARRRARRRRRRAARRRRAPAHRARRPGHDRATSTSLRADEPAAHRGHRLPDRRRARGRRPPARVAELRRLAVRARGRRRSRPRTTRSTPSRPPTRARRSPRSATWRRAVTVADGLEGFVLRYGGFYGPGTSIDAGGEHARAVRKRRFPVRGAGPASGRSSTSTTPPPPPSRRSSTARRASTTSSTTTRRRSASGSPRSPAARRRRRGGCRAGSSASPGARRRSR